VAYRTRRTIPTLQGSCLLTDAVFAVAAIQHVSGIIGPIGPKRREDGPYPMVSLAAQVIALVGSLRYTAHRSVPEIHQALCDRGVPIAERSVTHLLQRYDLPDLPHTNNELEQYFGSARYHERRATGRKQASPGVVVRGAVRIVASVASRLHPVAGPELAPPDLTRWRARRERTGSPPRSTAYAVPLP
jgi:hypothetical protein